MVSRVQIVGHDKPNADAFTGLEREVTVDIDNDELRVHDGATPGGHRLPNLATLQVLFQAVDTELTAIAALDETVGLLVKSGLNSYERRVLTGSGGEVVVTNGDGVAGNPVVSLPTSITKALTLTQLLTADGGIAGDVTGDLTGDSTGTHTGAVNGAHTGTSAGVHTGAQVGDVDVRGATLLLDANQIAESEVSGLTAQLTRHNPLKSTNGREIRMWQGPLGEIPTDWQLSDGTNGTADLRDSFIIGAGGSLAVDATGGNSTHSHANGVAASDGAHTHGITINNYTLTVSDIPSHSHALATEGESDLESDWSTPIKYMATLDTVGASDTRYGLSHTTSPANVGQVGLTGAGGSHNHTGSSASAGAHTHSVTADAANHEPPYYALAFIAYMGP